MLAILWFLAKVIDLFLTEIILMQGGSEANLVLKPLVQFGSIHGQYTILILITLSSLLILFLDYYSKEYPIVREILTFLVASSFIVCFYNVALILI